MCFNKSFDIMNMKKQLTDKPHRTLWNQPFCLTRPVNCLLRAYLLSCYLPLTSTNGWPVL